MWQENEISMIILPIKSHSRIIWCNFCYSKTHKNICSSKRIKILIESYMFTFIRNYKMTNLCKNSHLHLIHLHSHFYRHTIKIHRYTVFHLGIPPRTAHSRLLQVYPLVYVIFYMLNRIELI